VGSNLSVLGNAFIDKDLYTSSIYTGTISSFQVNIDQNLSTLGNAFFAKEIYTTSSILTTGTISTLEDVNVARNVSILGNLYVQGMVHLNQKEVDLQDILVSSLVAKGSISTLSSLSAGGYLNIGGSTILTGTVTALSNLNVAGLLSTTSTVVIGDSLLVENTGYFGSNLSISSFVNVLTDLNVGGSFTTQNLEALSTTISTLAVTNTVGFGLNISSSTLVAGLFSTSGAMNIGGRISTTNALIVGSTIDTHHLITRAGMSVLSNAGFAQDIFARSSLIVGMSTVSGSVYANSANLLSNLIIGTPATGHLSNYGILSNGGTANFAAAVNIQGVTTMSNVLNVGPFNSFLGNATNRISNDTWMSSLTTTYQSTIGQASFYSSVQIQGGLSVFSSLTATNINFTGTLYSNGTIFQGGGGSIPGINTTGTVGINSASNASFSLLVTGNQSNTGTLGLSGQPTIGGTNGTDGAGNTFIRLNQNLSQQNWSYICSTNLLNDVSLTANCYISNATVYAQNTAGAYSFVSARQGQIKFWCGANASITGAGTADSNLTTMLLTTSGLDVTGDIVASGNVTAYSDFRKKDNIVTVDTPLEKIMKMRGVYYTRINENTRQLGVIAQEVEEVLPEVIHTDISGFKSVAYGNIVALLIEAVKAQQSTIDYLCRT
jgi:predicted acyltransferase (DUF342 family)